jgi:hypothetical protein
MKKENSFHSFEIEFADAAKCLAHPVWRNEKYNVITDNFQ